VFGTFGVIPVVNKEVVNKVRS